MAKEGGQPIGTGKKKQKKELPPLFSKLEHTPNNNLLKVYEIHIDSDLQNYKIINACYLNPIYL